MKRISFSSHLLKEPVKSASRFWQDKENPYSIPNIIKRYGIKPPQTFRLYALAKKDYGWVLTTVKSLEDGLKIEYKEAAGILISKLFPKKESKK